jgi:hypothetical protein
VLKKDRIATKHPRDEALQNDWPAPISVYMRMYVNSINLPGDEIA